MKTLNLELRTLRSTIGHCSSFIYHQLKSRRIFCLIIMNIAIDYISVVGLRVIKCTHINCVKFVCLFENVCVVHKFFSAR